MAPTNSLCDVAIRKTQEKTTKQLTTAKKYEYKEAVGQKSTYSKCGRGQRDFPFDVDINNTGRETNRHIYFLEIERIR
jgi:hypothetical protein